MLEVKNLHQKYHEKTVLNNVSFSQPQGTVTAIIGPSGSGKTTLLRTLNALVQPQKGSISINDVTVDFEHTTKQGIKQLRSQSAMVFQNYNLFSNKTALENITEGLIYGQKYSKADAEKIAYELLDEVNLRQHANHYPIQLSGGQSQRIGIVRALALNPKLLLLDEPTSALDPESVTGILSLIKKIAQQGMTMTLVTHEIQFAEAVADQIIFIDHGEIIAQGSPEQVLHNREHPRLQQFLERVDTKQVIV
ncbi:amino acid ABC transporter ATP-binding protein [Staphylococcus muscae]|uniref:Arginine ABC transporter ATP-binding protein n=1 Tax=Staphylococcus muscae TaxID=1294 RepID=A0A240C887_9STAP|nr:amino acid ABC transporter ATP-binding protein [Staphylococcus muscae]AVQ33794.1 amino acid ABC transporter ATP-binding protein [Staphylococcus muscae]PNZ06301.1 amino acid ABC transporter ATP-binding protein [Staphylococcus muscae]GGA87781.1 arginine ABC transporter ATP-binding protein [Staphylococcus muscae]SNW04291.1 polar amino acid ABC transporter ATPase [Staphylococcus muscae]